MTSQIYSRVILDSYRKFTTDHAGENCTIQKDVPSKLKLFHISILVSIFNYGEMQNTSYLFYNWYLCVYLFCNFLKYP